MTTLADRIRNAPNARALNALLPNYAGLVNSSPRLWTVTIDGNAISFPEAFSDARERMAAMFDE